MNTVTHTRNSAGRLVGEITFNDWNSRKRPPCLHCGEAFTGQANQKFCHKLECRAVAEDKRNGIWEVWQGDTLVCSQRMKLTRSQAMNKVANEAKMGVVMVARRVRRSR